MAKLYNFHILLYFSKFLQIRAIDYTFYQCPIIPFTLQKRCSIYINYLSNLFVEMVLPFIKIKLCTNSWTICHFLAKRARDQNLLLSFYPSVKDPSWIWKLILKFWDRQVQPCVRHPKAKLDYKQMIFCSLRCWARVSLGVSI